MTGLPDLVTAGQFRQLPERREFAYELQHGEVVAMTHPKSRYVELAPKTAKRSSYLCGAP
jgi:hypothetical protein